MRTFLKHPCFHKITPILLWTILFFPMVIYGHSIIKYAINFPFYDDFDTILNFTSAFTQAQTPLGKLVLLFSQHNEHRLVLNRIVTLSYYYLFHEVNFKSFILMGNLGWILTALMLVFYFRKNFHLSAGYLIPIPYLLLTFIHRESMFMATAAIQFYWFMFFSIAFLIGLSKDKTLLYCSIFPLVMFIYGGGIVLYPLGLLFLASRKKWKSLLYFFFISTSCILLYFYHYVTPENSLSIIEAILNPIRSIAYFFAFLGNILPIDIFSIPIGFLFCFLSIYFMLKRNGDSFLQLTIGFILLTAILATLTRSSLGVSLAGSNRYSLYPLLGMVCIYMFMITSPFRESSAYKVVLPCAILFSMAYWGTVAVYSETTHYFQQLMDKRVATFVDFSNGHKEDLLYPNKDSAAQALINSEQQHIYNYKNQLP